MTCKWWEPSSKMKTPIDKRTWTALYPVYYGRIGGPNSRMGWWWLYGCKECGAEGIWSPVSGVRVCECQKVKNNGSIIRRDSRAGGVPRQYTCPICCKTLHNEPKHHLGYCDVCSWMVGGPMPEGMVAGV